MLLQMRKRENYNDSGYKVCKTLVERNLHNERLDNRNVFFVFEKYLRKAAPQCP